jgi:hypothetical protein
MATREEFLSAVCGGKRKFEEVTLPASKLVVRIRSLFQGEISQHQMATTDAAGKWVRARAEDNERRLVRECVVDADGNLLLTVEDVASLKLADPKDFYHLHQKCVALCGLLRDGVEEQEKNSNAIPGDDSHTG